MSLTLLLFFSSWFSPQVAIALDNEQEVSIHQPYLCDLFVSTRLDEGFASAPELIHTFVALPEVLSPTVSGESNWTRPYPKDIGVTVIQEMTYLRSQWRNLDEVRLVPSVLRDISFKMGGAEAYKSLLSDAHRELLEGVKNARRTWLSDAQNILTRLQEYPASISVGDLLTIVWLNAAIQDPIRVFTLVDELMAQYYKEYNRAGHTPSGVTEYLLRIGREHLGTLREVVDRHQFVLLIPKLRMPSLRVENFSIGLPIAWISLDQPVKYFFEAIENAAWVADSVRVLENWNLNKVLKNYISIQDAYSHALYLAEVEPDERYDTRVERVIDHIFRRFLFEGLYTRNQMLDALATYSTAQGELKSESFKKLYYEMREALKSEEGFQGGGGGHPKLRMKELGYALGYISFSLKSDKIRAEGQRGLRLQKRPI